MNRSAMLNGRENAPRVANYNSVANVNLLECLKCEHLKTVTKVTNTYVISISIIHKQKKNVHSLQLFFILLCNIHNDTSFCQLFCPLQKPAALSYMDLMPDCLKLYTVFPRL